MAKKTAKPFKARAPLGPEPAPFGPQQLSGAKVNPITGTDANSYTQAIGHTLPAPTSPKAYGPNLQGITSTKKAPLEDTEIAQRSKNNRKAVKTFDADGARLRGLHQEATKPGGVVDAQIGYGKPEGMTDRHFAWVTGAQHMFPNEGAARGNPAINEPHETDDGVNVQRRAEDLSGPEYRKGLSVLAHHGHGTADPMGSLRDTQARTLNRVIAEHLQAGVEESASQMFYGGRVNTAIPDQPEMEDAHFAGVHAANDRFRQGVHTVLNHPQFQEATQHLTPPERTKAATNMMAQGTSTTSPRSKWRVNKHWPNIEDAEAGVVSGLTGKHPVTVKSSGFPGNTLKAAGQVSEMVRQKDFGVTQFQNPDMKAAKTGAFVGALVDRDATDAYKVADVHEASTMIPGAPTSKALKYTGGNKTGKTEVFPDQPKSDKRGLQPAWKMLSNKLVPDHGSSRAEAMLAKGGGVVHALNDRATREALTNSGLSRSVNHSDNVHSAQAAVWGSQQMIRPDVQVSHADQYPVVRDWGQEGHNVPNGADVLGALSRGDTHSNMGAQFRLNPNTTGRSKSKATAHLVNPTKSKPYPVMPGE
jgi:hypothetical protein